MSSGKPRPEVLVTWPDYDTEAEGLGLALVDAGLALRMRPKHGARSRGEMRELIDGAVAAIVSTDPFDAVLLAANPALRVIARVGVGIDSIDLAEATRHGIAVTATPGANESTVADHTIALMLAVIRRICEHDGGVRAGSWNRTGPSTPWTLSGSTVGLVGYGRIGRLVAKRLSGFDVEVLVADPAVPSTSGARLVELSELLAVANVVSLHLPLLPSTRGLIGREELALMRPDAILVNTARGDIVDEAALLASLLDGQLRGAGLDVFAEEPPRSPRLMGLPNVVLSPHNAGISVDSVAAMTRRATASVIDVLRNRIPNDLVNPEIVRNGGFSGGEIRSVDGHA